MYKPFKATFGLVTVRVLVLYPLKVVPAFDELIGFQINPSLEINQKYVAVFDAVPVNVVVPLEQIVLSVG